MHYIHIKLGEINTITIEKEKMNRLNIRNHGYEINFKVMDNFHVKLFKVQKILYSYMQTFLNLISKL